jgi:type II secretory pathway pseudopilin PulG
MCLNNDKSKIRSGWRSNQGFTIPEVIIAGMIMIILSVGIMSVFTNVVQRNRGENLRMQALSVLQQEVEFYRSLKFIPVGSDSRLAGATYNNVRTRTSKDGQNFNISVVITNLPAGVTEANCKFKEITITAVPTVTQTGWLANLNTSVTLQRVRSN